MKKEKIFLIKIGENYHLSTNKQTKECYHLVFKEILDVNGIGEKSGEIFHDKGWNKPNEVLFIDTEAKISKENCDEIFGVVDIKKLAIEEFKNSSWTQGFPEHFEEYFIEIYNGAFGTAMDLNKDKVFTFNDLKEAYLLGCKHQTTNVYHIERNLKKLIKPTEIEVDLIMGQMKLNDDGQEYGFPDMNLPKIDEKGCLILKNI